MKILSAKRNTTYGGSTWQSISDTSYTPKKEIAGPLQISDCSPNPDVVQREQKFALLTKQSLGLQ